ncbi:hypothetical protein [Couchioplanes caeruleus]|uniref:Hemolysin type calcium-binding protein n=1 Tax=Couchioplanes caeruleus TaxID=56438 RepID=A0A3N1GV03_9ACTN|nr:hypothetical protein [Couchioplanes caeruleus]ROP34100.1 hypothetical protein EDD30_7170 [Couchioplanes caeruleus]
MQTTDRTRRKIRLSLVLTVAGVATTVLLAPAGPAAAAEPRPTCEGRAATIVSSGAVVNGTDRDDVIVVTGLRPSVNAGRGNDRICMRGTGSAVINGNEGDDRIVGAGADGRPAGSGAGTADQLNGGAGKDTIFAGIGVRNTLNGGDGDDALDVSASLDGNVLNGGSGADTLLASGNRLRDRADGGSGADVCVVDDRDEPISCTRRLARS